MQPRLSQGAFLYVAGGLVPKGKGRPMHPGELGHCCPWRSSYPEGRPQRLLIRENRRQDNLRRALQIDSGHVIADEQIHSYGDTRPLRTFAGCSRKTKHTYYQ